MLVPATAPVTSPTSSVADTPQATTPTSGAETLEDRAIEWFEANGGLTRANGDRLRSMVLSRGNTEDLAQMYENWISGAPQA